MGWYMDEGAISSQVGVEGGQSLTVCLCVFQFVHGRFLPISFYMFAALRWASFFHSAHLPWCFCIITGLNAMKPIGQAENKHRSTLPGAPYTKSFVTVMQMTNPKLNFFVLTTSKSLIFALWSHLRNMQSGTCLHFYWEERYITNWKILISIPFFSWDPLETSKLIVLEEFR